MLCTLCKTPEIFVKVTSTMTQFDVFSIQREGRRLNLIQRMFQRLLHRKPAQNVSGLAQRVFPYYMLAGGLTLPARLGSALLCGLDERGSAQYVPHLSWTSRVFSSWEKAEIQKEVAET